MTVKEYMEKWNINNEKKVIEWIKKDFIPGTTYNKCNETYEIIDSARIPYTSARAKNSNSIIEKHSESN